jgi:hypothetical protein
MESSTRSKQLLTIVLLTIACFYLIINLLLTPVAVALGDLLPHAFECPNELKYPDWAISAGRGNINAPNLPIDHFPYSARLFHLYSPVSPC